MLNFEDKPLLKRYEGVKGLDGEANDPNFAKTEEKRQNYHMNELEKELNKLQRKSQFEVDIEFRKLNEIIGNGWVRIECCCCKVELSQEGDITYKDLIIHMAKSSNFQEFDDSVLEGFEECEANLFLAVFS